jgi:hypothetical protein
LSLPETTTAAAARAVAQARGALERREAAHATLCEALAQAHEGGLTWRQIAPSIGLAHSTVFRLARQARRAE